MEVRTDWEESGLRRELGLDPHRMNWVLAGCSQSGMLFARSFFANQG